MFTQVAAEGGSVNGTVGVLASTHAPFVPGTSDTWQTTVLVYNSDDNSTSTSTDHLSVSLQALPAHKGGQSNMECAQTLFTGPYSVEAFWIPIEVTFPRLFSIHNHIAAPVSYSSVFCRFQVLCT